MIFVIEDSNLTFSYVGILVQPIGPFLDIWENPGSVLTTNSPVFNGALPGFRKTLHLKTVAVLSTEQTIFQTFPVYQFQQPVLCWPLFIHNSITVWSTASIIPCII